MAFSDDSIAHSNFFRSGNILKSKSFNTEIFKIEFWNCWQQLEMLIEWFRIMECEFVLLKISPAYLSSASHTYYRRYSKILRRYSKTENLSSWQNCFLKIWSFVDLRNFLTLLFSFWIYLFEARFTQFSAIFQKN